jgi:chemotaxis protein methyltransferase CheR
VLGLDSPRFGPDRPPTAVDIRRLEVFAAQAAVGLVNARLYADSQQDRARLRNLLRERRELRQQLHELRGAIRQAYSFGPIVGESVPMRNLLEEIAQVAASDVSVLLLGETGTGKELLARALHERSRRASRPFVAVNCAALPEHLVESEMFGFERGAFTGAHMRKPGRFEIAHRGTLFLDEIGDLPPEIQAKLLRVLQNREFERLGSSHTRKTDVRVIAATHRQLDAAVANGQFRADLYYRLSVFPIRLPPLRERREDIPALVWSFIRKRQHAIGRCITRVPASVMHRLQSYSWPGNIRELENVIERALIHSSGDAIELLDDFEIDTRQPYSGATTLLSVERKHIQEVLRDCDWRINGSGNAAEQLGLHPNTLRFRMKKLGIARTRPAPESSALLGSTQGAMRRH